MAVCRYHPWSQLKTNETQIQKYYLDVPLEVRITGSDQWVISPTYKWDISGL